MTAYELQDLAREMIDSPDNPMVRRVAALVKAANQLGQRISEQQQFYKGLDWLFEDEPSQGPVTTTSTKGKNMVQKYAIRGGAAGSTSSTATRNPIPGVSGPATGRGAPTVRPLTDDQKRLMRTDAESRRVTDARRKGLGQPSLAIEEKLLDQARKALSTPGGGQWNKFAEHCKLVLSGYKSVPRSLESLR